MRVDKTLFMHALILYGFCRWNLPATVLSSSQADGIWLTFCRLFIHISYTIKITCYYNVRFYVTSGAMR